MVEKEKSYMICKIEFKKFLIKASVNTEKKKFTRFTSELESS